MEFSFDSLLNARPLDVHVWSDYSEVNLFVNHIYDELSSLDGHEKVNKKLLKVLLLDLYVCWSTDPNPRLCLVGIIMLMQSLGIMNYT